MAKQPWQESKKKNNGDINREMKRAEIKREQKIKNDAIAAKAKKAKQMGFLTLLLGFVLYWFASLGTQQNTADVVLFQVLSTFLVMISGVSCAMYGKYSNNSPKMWYVIGGGLVGIGIVLCAMVLM